MHEVQQAATLADVVEQLGTGIVELIVAPRGVDVPIASVGILDPDEPNPEAADLLLGVGVAASVSSSLSAVEQAGKSGAAALVLKAFDDQELPAAIVVAAQREGVALVRAERGASWTRLLNFCQTLCDAGLPSDADDGGIQIGDLFGLATAIAAMAGGPVTIEDLQSNVLAFSNIEGADIDRPRRDSILGRRVPDAHLQVLNEAGVFRHLWSSEDVVRVTDTGMPDTMRDRLAIAVRAGGQPLGSIWVAENGAPLEQEAEEALRHGARMAAIHLMHRRYGRKSERRLHAETLRKLLDGDGPPLVQVRQLGVQAARSWAVLAVSIADQEAVETLLAREALIDLIGAHCDVSGWQSCQAIIGGRAFALIAGNPRSSASLVELAAHIAGKAEKSLGLDVRAGVSDPVEKPEDIGAARRQAEYALDTILAMVDAPLAARLQDVAAAAVFVELKRMADAGSLPWPRQLDALIAYDEANGTDYVITLRAYLDAFGDVKAASARVFVHQNTFRYRLRRLAEIAGFDITDPDVRVAVELELRLHQPGRSAIQSNQST